MASDMIGQSAEGPNGGREQSVVDTRPYGDRIEHSRVSARASPADRRGGVGVVRSVVVEAQRGGAAPRRRHISDACPLGGGREKRTTSEIGVTDIGAFQ